MRRRTSRPSQRRDRLQLTRQASPRHPTADAPRAAKLAPRRTGAEPRRDRPSRGQPRGPRVGDAPDGLRVTPRPARRAATARTPTRTRQRRATMRCCHRLTAGAQLRPRWSAVGPGTRQRGARWWACVSPRAGASSGATLASVAAVPHQRPAHLRTLGRAAYTPGPHSGEEGSGGAGGSRLPGSEHGRSRFAAASAVTTAEPDGAAGPTAAARSPPPPGRPPPPPPPLAGPRPSPPCASSRPASCAARTTGPASRSSAMLVDLGVLEEFPSNTIPGFTDALVALLPTPRGPRLLARPARRLHHPAPGRDLGRPRRRAHRARVPEPRRHGRPPRQDPRHGRVRPLQRASSSTARSRSGIEAGRMAVALVNHLVAPDDPDVRLRLRAASSSASSAWPSARRSGRPRRRSSTRRSAATSRSSGSTATRLVQLGQGVHQQRIRATMTSGPAASRWTSRRDKSLTNRLLDSRRPAGAALRGRRDRGRRRRAPRDRIGYPCVRQAARRQPRPRRRTWTCARRGGRPRRRSARRSRQSRGGDVVVESYVTGNDYRCLVIGGKVAAIAERVPASVTGDGEHTVRELVDIANADPRRGIGHEKVLTRIKLDDGAEELAARARASTLGRRPARRAPSSSSR